MVSGAGDYKPGIVLDKQQSSIPGNPLRCSAKPTAKSMHSMALLKWAIC